MHTYVAADYTQAFPDCTYGYNFIIMLTLPIFYDPNEQWLNNNLRRGIFVPDADFGAYLLNQNTHRFSSQQIFGSAAKIGDMPTKLQDVQPIHVWLLLYRI